MIHPSLTHTSSDHPTKPTILLNTKLSVSLLSTTKSQTKLLLIDAFIAIELKIDAIHTADTTASISGN